MTSETGQQIIVILILPNISRSKCKQTTKLDQFIKCNRNIFLKKLYTKCVWEASPIPFHKKLELSISLDQQPELL